MKKRIGLLTTVVAVLIVAVLGIFLYFNSNGAHQHEYGEWIIDTNASCTRAGQRVKTCSCGEEIVEEIPATGHIEEKDAAVAATCKKEGLTEGSHCSTCKKIIVEQETVPVAHEEKSLPGVAATCTKAGKTSGTECTLCGEIVKKQEKVQAEHKYKNGVCTVCGKAQPDTSAAIDVDQLNESVPMCITTKKAYPGGSTITFQAYVPEKTGWWGVCWTTDLTDKKQVGLYKWSNNAKLGKTFHYGNDGTTQEKGTWAEYSATLPNDGKEYYIYFVGGKGSWKGNELLIDEVRITNASGKVLGTDNFDDGVEEGLFSTIAHNKSTSKPIVYGKEHTKVAITATEATCTTPGCTAGMVCSVCGKIYEESHELPALGHTWKDKKCTVCGVDYVNIAAGINIDKLNQGQPMNFITKDTYPAGSKFTFKAYVPEDTSWWSVNWTTAPKDNTKTGVYKFANGSGQSFHYGKDGTTQKKGEWAEYTVTLPSDGGPYYIYVVGNVNNWKGQELLIDEVKITDSKGKTLAVDDFDNGLAASIFDITYQSSKGDVVVREVPIIVPCEDGHTEVVDAAVAATCTTTGKTEGSHCLVCGEVIHAQTEIPATGHQWKDGKCTVCTKDYENIAVSIQMDKITENKVMNFISKNAYPGGSTITFDAFVPDNNKIWVAVGWTTDLMDESHIGVYKWSGSDGKYGQQIPNNKLTKGDWATYTVTLPEGDDSYYIYIGGNRGNWEMSPMLIDNFKVTNGEEVLLDETFDNGITSWPFTIVEKDSAGDTVVEEYIIVDPCANGHTEVIDQAVEATCTQAGKTEGKHCSVCEEVLVAQQDIPATGHNWVNDQCACGAKRESKYASININKMRETMKMDFITKQAYPAGSTITFKAYVPEGVGWLAIGWITDLTDEANISVYRWSKTDGAAYGKQMTTKKGEWAEYSVTLPEGDKPYYIYVAGQVGGWKVDGEDAPLLMDDFKVTNADGTQVYAEENFNGAMSDWIFTVNQNGKDIVSEVVVKVENKAVSILVDKMSEKVQTEGKMNLITKNAYPGGSEVTFKAFVPNGVSAWWALQWTTDKDATDLSIYKWAATPSEGVSLASQTVKGEWKEYTVTLPDDDKQYYLYFAAQKGAWKVDGTSVELLIDDFKVTAKDGSTVLVEENFNGETSSWCFDVTEKTKDGTTTVVSTVKIVEENKSVSILVDKMSETVQTEGKMNLITKNAYPGGSKVTFKAFVPEGVSGWWALQWTTDKDATDLSLYQWSKGNGESLASQTVKGEWKEYTVTLPDDTNNYYIYFAAQKGAWKVDGTSVELKIDDFKVTAKDGSTILAEEDFNGSMSDWIFDVTEKTKDGTTTVVTSVKFEEPAAQEQSLVAALFSRIKSLFA